LGAQEPQNEVSVSENEAELNEMIHAINKLTNQDNEGQKKNTKKTAKIPLTKSTSSDDSVSSSDDDEVEIKRPIKERSLKGKRRAYVAPSKKTYVAPAPVKKAWTPPPKKYSPPKKYTPPPKKYTPVVHSKKCSGKGCYRMLNDKDDSLRTLRGKRRAYVAPKKYSPPKKYTPPPKKYTPPPKKYTPVIHSKKCSGKGCYRLLNDKNDSLRTLRGKRRAYVAPSKKTYVAPAPVKKAYVAPIHSKKSMHTHGW